MENVKNKKLSDVIIHYNGLDRIDNNKGYLKDNIVPCCKYCNVAKNNLSQSEFKNLIKRIYKHYIIV